MTTLNDVVVLLGPGLEPWMCKRFEWSADTIVTVDRVEPVLAIEKGTRVIIPGLCNSHTHMGDSCMPDGATGLTLEQGFFRPNGFKYRRLWNFFGGHVQSARGTMAAGKLHESQKNQGAGVTRHPAKSNSWRGRKS